MSDPTAVLDKESAVSSKYATVQLGSHVVNTMDGSQVEFVKEDGKTILVHVRSGEKGDPLAISRALLVGDGKTERSSVFQDYVILPAFAVIDDGQMTYIDKNKTIPVPGVAYFAAERRLVSLEPAVYWHDGIALKDSPVRYRTRGRSYDKGVVISEIRVIIPDAEPLPA